MAISGGKRPRKSGVDEVFEPWLGYLQGSLVPRCVLTAYGIQARRNIFPKLWNDGHPRGTVRIDEHGFVQERSRVPLIRTLHQRGPDKRQTPDPDQREHATGRLLEDFLDFLCRPLGLVHDFEDETRGGVSGVKAPGLLEEPQSA